MSGAETSPAEHPIHSYLQVKKQLTRIDSSHYGYGSTEPVIDVVVGSALTVVLEKLISTPWTDSEKLDWLDLLNCQISVFGEEAGTIGEPNVDVIMAKTKPSSFGKGDQTVYDPSYRNGREIAASDLKLSKESTIIRFLEPEVMEALYPFDPKDRKTIIELYKLAVYEKGGHFDWHKDSTHGDNHHATLLVALNTEWKGGQLKLRHNGVEFTPDIHPSSKGAVGVVAFYTDVEHMVEPVEEGVRLVLQFDIRFEKKHDEAQSDAKSDSDSVLEAGEVIRDMLEPDTAYPDQEPLLRAPIVSFSGNQGQLDEMVEVIKRYHKEMKVYEVGFPLQHSYRQASIQPKYLKGIDALLYETLKDKFDVSLHPILLYHRQEYDGYKDYVVKFEASYKAENEDSEGEEQEPPSKKKKLSLKKVFHLAKPVAPLAVVSSTPYAEYTGNEAQPGETKYFAGGMFVRAVGKAK